MGGSLQFVEACIVSSGCEGREGRLTLTGQLGDVLEESARIALSWCRSNAVRLGLVGQRAGSSPLGVSVHANGKKNSRAVLAPDHDQLQRRALAAAPRQAGDEIAAVAGGGEPLAVFAADIHVHFPAGAIPKDGPSAGMQRVCVVQECRSESCLWLFVMLAPLAPLFVHVVLPPLFVMLA